MSVIESKLCTLLVKELFGAFHSRIFSILIKNGRLHITQISQKAHLTARSVRASVAVLLQADLINHILGENGVSFYEANPRQAFNLMRVGRMIGLVESECGLNAAKIMLFLLQHGRSRANALEQIPLTYQHLGEALRAGNGQNRGDNNLPNRQPTTNGFTDTHIENMLLDGQLDTSAKVDPSIGNHAGHPQRFSSLLKDALLTLSEARLIHNVGAAHRESEQDSRSASGPIESPYVDQNALKNLTQISDGEAVHVTNSRKRKADDMNVGHQIPPSKRSKMMVPVSVRDIGRLSGHPLSDDLSNESIDPELLSVSRASDGTTLQANNEKLLVLLRNQAIQSLAERNLAEETATVYAAILHQLQRQIHRCHDEPGTISTARLNNQERSNPTVINIQSLAQDLSSRPRLNRGSGKVSHRSHQNNGHHARQNDGTMSDRRDDDRVRAENPGYVQNGNEWINGHTNGTSSDDHNNQDKPDKYGLSNQNIDANEDMKHHLVSLKMSSPQFVENRHTGDQPEWIVPFDSLLRTLQNEEILCLLRAQYGKVAARLVRLLMEKGKTDERNLQEMALMTPKDMRQILSQLKRAGFVDLQEIARENQRTQSRAMFLWFYNEERVRRLTLDWSLTGIIRCLQRLDFERKKVGSILTKAGRLDVRGNSKKTDMEDHESRRLRRWKHKEKQLLGALDRLDRVLLILRDF